MPSSAKSSAHADKLAIYEKIVKTNAKVERKGATNPYTSLNGNMFSRLDPSGTLSLRLREGDRAAFLKKHKATLYSSYGVVQKESVPETLWKDPKALQKYFDLSYEYAKTLKPKATRKGS